MENKEQGQELAHRKMSFAEIILTYARNPPFEISEYLKMGRRTRKRSELTHDLLIVIESEALINGASLKEVREEYRRTLGSVPEHVTRSLTVDEFVSLCERFELNMDNILTKALGQDLGQDQKKESNS